MKKAISFLVVIVLVLFVAWQLNICSTAETKIANVEETVGDEISFGSDLYAQNLIVQNSETNFLNPLLKIQDPNASAHIFAPSSKSPMLAATLGVVPGLGHVYLNDMKTATALAGSAGVGVGLCFGKNDQVQISGEMGLLTTGFYSVYSAYRDARLYYDDYTYPMPVENLADLAYAPFQWSVIKKPEVWGGIAVTLGLAIGALYLSGNAEPASVGRSDMPYLSLPKAVGEEAFFRGFLQSALSEPCTPWGGIALSSVAFGVAHIRNAFDLPPDSRTGYYTFGIPLITGLGVYYGWLTYKNHSLKESVAVHTWYNFIVMMTSAWIAHRASIGNQGFAIQIPF